MKSTSRIILAVLSLLTLIQCKTPKQDQWSEDFDNQPVSTRPSLEVNYTDSRRESFQILAEDYSLTGQLRKPHVLIDENGNDWFWMEVTDRDGKVYSTRFSETPTRINLFRRGTYFCEVHWLDLQPVSADGEVAPLKGDVALFCYPEKIIVEVAWHGIEDFQAEKMMVKGIAPSDHEFGSLQKGKKKLFNFPLFGEEEPLTTEAFDLIEGEVPLKYNARKGYYEIGTVTSGNFSKYFYETPNHYETAAFSIQNDSVPRKIYIGHKSVEGGGSVEGGMVLDEDGHPMPILVQVCKNFSGEKEEIFYNPDDTSFSETYFPLYLEPGEKMTLSSLHLYQNWGRHLTKHWSSLGAWMDYFHSSTGVTETTCYVPFKFAGIGGVAIADFRAMSQLTYWRNGAQHDNLAGHSFLSFYDGENWQHSKYIRTVYRSTGPNWYDIQLQYISADSSIKATVDIWETPQSDELRSFFKVRYEVLKPLSIKDATANFRFLTITSTIQKHRFTKVAASGMEDMDIDFTKTFPLKGHPLPEKNAFLAKYGEYAKDDWGSNAIIIREFKGPGDIGPAASLQAGIYKDRFKDAMVQTNKLNDDPEDTRLFLAPDTDVLELKPGDVFEIDGFWLPYGEVNGSETPKREVSTYAIGKPDIISCAKGTILSDLPVRINAENNEAEFTLKGGKDLLPVIINGLSDWKYPRIYKKEDKAWRPLYHSRNWELDGYQVFAEGKGKFGAVFLVHSDENEQTLKVVAGVKDEVHDKIEIIPVTDNPASGVISIQKDNEEIRLKFRTLSSSVSEWMESEAGSLWMKTDQKDMTIGARVTPNQGDLDLEYWWQVNEKSFSPEPQEIVLDLKGTSFESGIDEGIMFLQEGVWIRAENDEITHAPGLKAIMVESSASGEFLCLAWPGVRNIIIDKTEKQIGLALEPYDIALESYHTRGKIFIMKTTPEVVQDRVGKELVNR